MSWGLSLSIASTHDRLFMLKTPHAHFIEMHRYFIEIKTIISVKSCLVSLKWILSSSCIRHDIKIPPLGGGFIIYLVLVKRTCCVYRVWIMGIRSHSYPTGTIVRALLRYRAGSSQREISEIMEIPRSTIRGWLSSFDSGRIGSRVGDHSHIWIIDSPNGAFSTGICSICFNAKDFPNYGRSNTYWPEVENGKSKGRQENEGHE